MTHPRQGPGGPGAGQARWVPIAFRAIAMLIAVAGIVDPGWWASRRAVPVVVAIDLTSGAGDALAAALQSSAPAWKVVTRRGEGPRLPCGVEERCVMLADGSIDAGIPDDVRAPVSLIASRPAGSPNVSLRSATGSAANAAAAGAITIELWRTGEVPVTEVRVLDGTALVGSLTYDWAEAESAVLDVPWWPIDAGVRTLTIEAVPTFAKATVGQPVERELTLIDNTIVLGVTVTEGPVRVLVFDARPSWGSTFVRRSLEDDSRFAVEYRSRLAPSVTAGTRGGSLDASAVDGFPVVMIGGPDALTDTDVALLERYVRVRGGSLILLPEQRVTGPASRFFGNGWTEHLVSAPEPVGPLQASEILRVPDAPPVAAVLGRSAGLPSMVAIPSGGGRVIISGAMDAWRFRHLDASTSLSASPSTSPRADADNRFDGFWRSLVADAAAAGEALRIDLGTSVAAPTDRVPFVVRRRTLEPPSMLEARVSVRCDGGEATSIRAWPSGSIGEFVGEIPARTGEACDVLATIDGRTAHASFAIAGRSRRGVDMTLDQLERQARATGGVFAKAGDEAAIARALDARPAESPRGVSLHPLRSAWWIVPFAVCLSAEWWLRRRAGLR